MAMNGAVLVVKENQDPGVAHEKQLQKIKRSMRYIATEKGQELIQSRNGGRSHAYSVY